VWTLENCDFVRHSEPVENRAGRQRPTLVKAEESGPRRFLLDDDRNVFHEPAKAPWNAAQRVLDYEFEFGNLQH
jgi:hypothetical protein